MKKCLSLVLSLIIALVPLFAFASPAGAETYEEQLKKKGFPDSYIPKLAALHKKYPNWNFVPFKTGLDFSNAVKGERSTHKKQILETGYNSNYYCSCSNCKKNGKFVYVYSGCYSASEWAVKYYLDPRNHLDEKHIFQFESNKYNSSHNQSGVESIISKTWMKNSTISYTRTFGDTATYTDSNGNKPKYSKVILDAAKAHNISAYFIASRIVKEVGSTKPTASGTAGTKSPFIGIYNYYSIGATSGGMSGVEWASGYLLASKATSLYPGYDKSAKKPTGTASSVASGTRMSYIGTYDNYYKVKLYSDSSGYSTNGKTGFVPISALRTTYFTYGRPWTSPAKSIDGGAHYIADKYLTYQYTSYLEKFNVNKSSGSLYNHEYMQNVDAPTVESVSRYNAYSNAGQLSASKTFYIPVFNNMPSDTSTNVTTTAASSVKAVTCVKVKDTTTSSITVKWKKLSKATKYYVRVQDVASGKVYTKKVKTTSATVKNLTKGKVYNVWVRGYVGKWGAYSSKVQTRCVPKKASITKATSPSKGTVKVQWKKQGGAAGYQFVVAKDKKLKTRVADMFVKKNAASANNLPKGTYYVKTRAYITIGSAKFYGKYSAAKKIKVK